MKTYALFDDSFFQNKPWWMPLKLHNVVSIRANARSKEYMLDLLHEYFPEARVDQMDVPCENAQIILLYPDSIGLGWSHLEKRLWKKFQEVRVLNGRKRCFALTKHGRLKLVLRRFLEVTFLPEIVCAPFLLLYGTFLAIKDKIKGQS